MSVGPIVDKTQIYQLVKDLISKSKKIYVAVATFYVGQYGDKMLLFLTSPIHNKGHNPNKKRTANRPS